VSIEISAQERDALRAALPELINLARSVLVDVASGRELNAYEVYDLDGRVSDLRVLLEGEESDGQSIAWRAAQDIR
jgi:hypothetical protein